MAHGSLEVIVGSMFSGKSEELIRRLRRAQIARQKVQVFKPKIDDRYHAENVMSHDQNSISAKAIQKSSEILAAIDFDTQVIGIDEGQFFDPEIVQVAQSLAQQGLRVLVAGLDTDWQGKPFEPMPTLMAVADQVTKQHAVCVVCGAAASRTQRTGFPQNASTERVLVGAHDSYEARCRMHFKPEVVVPAQKWNETHPALEGDSRDVVL
jgi:thymidine kinase